jgi:hypothetical protein
MLEGVYCMHNGVHVGGEALLEASPHCVVYVLSVLRCNEDPCAQGR